MAKKGWLITYSHQPKNGTPLKQRTVITTLSIYEWFNIMVEGDSTIIAVDFAVEVKLPRK